MTTLYVATLGGHVSELVSLSDRLGDDDALWVTNDSVQTRDLLRGRSAEMVPYIDERDWTGVLRAVPHARSLFRGHDIDRVVSTGSAIALAYLPVAAALGVGAHYIECSARVESVSMTGRLLRRTPRVRCWWQYPSPPKGFRHAGSIFDEFFVDEGPAPPALQRIVVTVGTNEWSFRRLIARLVQIIPPDAEVLWQVGDTDVTGLGIEGRRLVPHAEIVDAMRRADVVITHAGAGSLNQTLQVGKVPVYVPRRARHREHVDDHQRELAAWADDQGLAVTVDADRLERHHLELAARLRASTRPAADLVLR